MKDDEELVNKKKRKELEKEFEKSIKTIEEYVTDKKKQKITPVFKGLCYVLNRHYNRNKPSVYQFIAALECYTQFFKEKTFTEFPYSEDDPRPIICKWTGEGTIHCTESIRKKKAKICDKCPENPALKKIQDNRLKTSASVHHPRNS